MVEQQNTTVDGRRIVTQRMGAAAEVHEFGTEEEARWRAAIINEALSWVGTPFRDCADIKGRNGGVDCAMLMVRSYVDTGRLAPFDPRPYKPRHMLHSSEEKFLRWIEENLGGIRTTEPRVGDCVVWMFGRCFSHGGILINSKECVHAYYVAGCTLLSRLEEPTLAKISLGPRDIDRPRLFFRVGER